MHVLWLKTELLHPVDKGGRIRTYNMLRELRTLHKVTYLTLDDGTAAPDAVERAAEYCDVLERVPFRVRAKGSPAFFAELAVNAVSSLPYAIAKYRAPAMTRRLRELLRRDAYDVVVCDFLFPSLNVPSDLGVPTVLFQHNVEAMIWRRHADVARDPMRRAYFASQWRRMLAFERAECRRFDAVVAVSPVDAAVFADEYGVARVAELPTGVDTEYFTPDRAVARTAHEMVFTGSLDWMPNEDGLVYFVEEVLPRIRAEVPDATLTVVGRNPPARLRELATRASGVTIAGRVPDVRPYLARAGLSVVPLRVGGGTRLKIYEAMAMECPVVSTTIGAEGLPVRDGEHLRIADTPDAMARAAVELMRSEARRAELARDAAAYVRREFGWAGVARRFAEICAETARAEPDVRGAMASASQPQ
jgi:sugar transferase (PEP-CTERM/EpsH1 system associated)